MVTFTARRVQVPYVARIRATSEFGGQREEIEEVACGSPGAGQVKDSLMPAGQPIRTWLRSANRLRPHDVVCDVPTSLPCGHRKPCRDADKEAVPVRKTVYQLPRLPFFGCEGVSEAQLRAIIEEVLNNPEF